MDALFALVLFGLLMLLPLVLSLFDKEEPCQPINSAP